MTARSPQTILRTVVVLLLCLAAVWVGSGVLASLVIETLWFQQLGYEQVFWVRVLTKSAAWLLLSTLSLAFIGTHLHWAQRWHYRPQAEPTDPTDPERLRQRRDRRIWQQTLPRALPGQSRPLSFRWLLALTSAASLFLSVVIIHYGLTVWQVVRALSDQTETMPIIPDRLRLDVLARLLKSLWAVDIPVIPYLGILLWVGLAIAILLYPRLLLSAIGLCLALGLGAVWSANWHALLLAGHPQSFNQTDPLLNINIGFYLFTLPIWQLVDYWLIGLTLYTLLAVLLRYLLSGNSLSQGTFPGFSLRQKQHLYGVAGCFMLSLAWSYWLRRYELLYSGQGAVFGAAYTEVHVQLPLYTLLAIANVAIAFYCFWQVGAYQTLRRKLTVAESEALIRPSKTQTRTLVRLLLILAIVAGLDLAATLLIPHLVQRLVVQPNELTKEKPYIEHNIALTRAAFHLDQIQDETFDPTTTLTFADLKNNSPTIRNIRLWDTRPLLETNRQLQQIRPYYRFFDADLDRYRLVDQPSPNQVETGTFLQQVLISARELDFAAVPADAKTWVNEHLVYTHGYGFTLSPVNKVAAGGLPDYFVKDIGTPQATKPQPGNDNLTAANDGIRASVPIGEPRIYFGELTNTYILTNTTLQELDYPSGDENVYNVYDGKGGVGTGQVWRRGLFARYLRDWQMLLTDYFTPDTQVLFRRNINQRIRAIAPFLKYDQDPYLVSVDIGCRGLNIGCEDTPITGKSPTPNYLYWIVDAYTVSDRYPYSQPSPIQGKNQVAAEPDQFNYIRNSVKVVIDAYNGSVNFYISDPDDPIIQAWAATFPGLLQPLSALPTALQGHLRYPIDLFNIQSERLMTYHMTDPQVFYNREDQWQIPDEIYGDQPRPVEPYFLITNLPTVVETEEFILLLPFKPTRRTNLTAWLAARADGKNYGKQLLYVFPKQRLVFGTEQIEARINQDPVISQQISLWNRQGSRVLQGNLLVIPIEQSLLYVEPLYLEAERNSLPTLVRVVVAYENRIAMANTLEQAIAAVFQPETTIPDPIVRPVE